MKRTEYRDYIRPTGEGFITKDKVEKFCLVIGTAGFVFAYFWLLFSGH